MEEEKWEGRKAEGKKERDNEGEKLKGEVRKEIQKAMKKIRGVRTEKGGKEGRLEGRERKDKEWIMAQGKQVREMVEQVEKDRVEVREEVERMTEVRDEMDKANLHLRISIMKEVKTQIKVLEKVGIKAAKRVEMVGKKQTKEMKKMTEEIINMTGGKQKLLILSNAKKIEEIENREETRKEDGEEERREEDKRIRIKEEIRLEVERKGLKIRKEIGAEMENKVQIVQEELEATIKRIEALTENIDEAMETGRNMDKRERILQNKM